jgi:hypothetical protein
MDYKRPPGSKLKEVIKFDRYGWQFHANRKLILLRHDLQVC